MSRTLLAVHAHPDDETVSMGGTLARYAAEGVRTVIVMCTTGDLGEIRGKLAPPDSVAAIRGRELAAAARTLGVARVAQLGYSDSGMAGLPENNRTGAFHVADLHEAAARIRAVIEEERPQVLVCYDETGGYGHPDHVKAHEVALAAYCGCDESVRPAKLYFIRYPLSWSRDFVQSLREAGIDAPGSAPTGADAGPSVSEIGVEDRLVTAAVDVRQYIAVKRAAMACHPSQWPPDHFIRRVPPALAQRLWAYEYYSRADVESLERERDLFEGLG